MDYTKNLNLSKPSYNDDVDVQVINNNMDILDDNLQQTNDKMNGYLPLAGGAMKGNIIVPYDIGLRLGQTDTAGSINFNTTSFNGVVLPTLKTKADRFKYYAPSGKEFVADDTGVWFDGDALIRDRYTSIQDFVGYIKLSTGVTMQWGFVNPSDSDGNIQHVTLQTPMPTPNYAVFTSRSNYTQNIKPDQDVPSNNATFNLTTTGFDILCARASRGRAMFWFVIGG